MTASETSFRSRLASGDLLYGSFIKSPGYCAVEIYGSLGFDFLVLDEEHAPLDRATIDAQILAARAARIATLVRIASPATILSALDCGATGILAPHVRDATCAREIAALCRYRGGKRGFSNSPRAGSYGALKMRDHLDRNDALVTVVAQIEDAEALAEIDAIAGTDGIDALFVGRADLAVALGADSPEDDKVAAATETVMRAARKAGKPVMIFATTVADTRAMCALGATAFILSSDQGHLRMGATQALDQTKEALGQTVGREQ